MKIKFNFGAILLIFSIILSNDLACALIYLLCAAAHEVGHLTAAKLLKIKISEMSFDIAGAKIIPAGQISSYKNEFILCAAGPIASISLAFGSFCLLTRGGASLSLPYLYSVIGGKILCNEHALVFIMIFSLLQAIINLIPISSFDGGRMLNAIITFLCGERMGELCSKILTFLFALILWMASVYLLLRIGQGLSLFSFSLCMFLKIFEEK